MSPVLWAWLLSAIGAAAFFVAGLALSRSRSRRAEPPALPPAPPPPQDHLQEELAQARAGLRTAETQLAQAQEREAQLGRKAEARDLELGEAQDREARLRQEQASRAQERPAPPPPSDAKEKAELRALRKKFEAAVQELRTARAATKSARSEQSSLELRLSRATKRYSEVSTERDTLAKQLRELEAGNAESSARFRETLSAHVADVEVSHEKAEKLANELLEQREATRHLTTDQKRQEQSIAQLEASQAEHERTIQEQATQLSLAKEEVERLLLERNRLQDDVATSASAATSDGDELERARREIGAANEALSARTRALEESRDEIARLKAQADEPAVDSEEQQELERVRREVAALREELIAKKLAFEEGREELAQLRSIGADLQAAEEAHSHTEAEVEHLRTALAAAQTSGPPVAVPSPAATPEEGDVADEAVSTMSLQELIEGVEALKSVWAAAVTDTSGLVVAGAGADNEVLSAMASTLFSAARRAEKELPIGSPVEFSVLDASGFRITVRSASSRHSRLLFATLSRGTVETEQSVRKLVAAIPRVTV